MTKVKRYILDGTNPVEEPDLKKWELWYAQANRVIRHTDIPVTNDNRFMLKILEPDCIVKVTTLFLGIDHALNGNTPLLYTTKIIGGQHDQRQQWTSTWEEAVFEHEFNVKALHNGGFTCLLK